MEGHRWDGAAEEEEEAGGGERGEGDGRCATARNRKVVRAAAQHARDPRRVKRECPVRGPPSDVRTCGGAAACPPTPMLRRVPRGPRDSRGRNSILPSW